MPQTYELNKAQPLSTDLSVDHEFHRTYTSTYMVFTARDQDPFNAGSVTDLPRYGYNYSWYGFNDLWAFAKHFDVKRQEEMTDPLSGDIVVKWLVTIKHDSKPTGGSNNLTQPRDNPLDDPPVIRGSFQSQGWPLERDFEGTPLANSAKIQYSAWQQPYEGLQAFDTLSISYNYATLDVSLRAQMINCVNSTTTWGFDPRVIKLIQWDYEILRAGPGFDYVKNHLVFEFDYRQTPPADLIHIGPENGDKFGHYLVLPDSGIEFWKGGVDKIGEETDEEREDRLTPGSALKKDENTNTEVKLDKNGDALDQTLEQRYNVFKIETERDFHTIPGFADPLPGPFV